MGDWVIQKRFEHALKLCSVIVCMWYTMLTTSYHKYTIGQHYYINSI